DAVNHVDDIAGWKAPDRRPARIGLVGWDVLTGLGYQNADLAKHLRVDRWLIPPQPNRPRIEDPHPECEKICISEYASENSLAPVLEGLDWILCVERPALAQLIRVAVANSIGIACIPNWEWMNPALGWLRSVDLMICPTHHTYKHICD